MNPLLKFERRLRLELVDVKPRIQSTSESVYCPECRVMDFSYSMLLCCLASLVPLKHLLLLLIKYLFLIKTKSD